MHFISVKTLTNATNLWLGIAPTSSSSTSNWLSGDPATLPAGWGGPYYRGPGEECFTYGFRLGSYWPTVSGRPCGDDTVTGLCYTAASICVDGGEGE